MVQTMVLKRRQRKRPAMRKRRQYGGYRRKGLKTNPRPIFTETCAASGPEGFGLTPAGIIQVQGGTLGSGGKFTIQMNNLPTDQVSAYQKLQHNYRILKVQAIIMPKWNSFDLSAAQQNNSVPVGNFEAPRITYAINDSTGTSSLVPVSELSVLPSNGCKIRKLTTPVKINFRPKACIDGLNGSGGIVPGTQAVQFQRKYNPFISFDGAGVNVPHVGVDWWVSSGNNADLTDTLNVAQVYQKITFQLSDPR